MKSQKGVAICITGLQILNASLFGGLIYCQTLLIGGLEYNSLKRPELIWTVLFMAGYVLSEILENYIREGIYAMYCAEISSKAAKTFLSEDMYHHAGKKEEQHISFFSNEISAVLQQNLYLRLYVQKQIVMFCFSLFTLFAVAKGYSLTVILAAALFGAVIHLLSRKLQDRQRYLQDKKAVFVERLMELYQGFEEIHINQMEKSAAQDFIQSNSDAEQAQYNYRLSLGWLEALGVGQNMIMYILILIGGGLLAQKGMAGIGVFVSAAELSVQALNEWTSITRLYSLVRGSEQLKKELDTYISTPGMTYRQKSAAAGDLLVDVQGLSFRYEENAPLLDNIELSIRKGEKYLIVGESGCGKSTLLELLSGHKSCDRGKLDFYTDRIAYVPQTPFLFSGTLKENLVFDRQIDENMVKRLMEKAGLDLSLDMEIKADGENLSGGQKARVALVRALLAEPELLIADELTANLDGRLGKQIEELLLNEYPQMALCVAAHKVYCRERYNVIKFL